MPETAFLLRLGKNLKLRAAARAAAEHRSLNSYIITLLEETCSTPGLTPSSEPSSSPPASSHSLPLQPSTATTPTTVPAAVFQTPA